MLKWNPWALFCSLAFKIDWFHITAFLNPSKVDRNSNMAEIADGFSLGNDLNYTQKVNFTVFVQFLFFLWINMKIQHMHASTLLRQSSKQLQRRAIAFSVRDLSALMLCHWDLFWQEFAYGLELDVFGQYGRNASKIRYFPQKKWF